MGRFDEALAELKPAQEIDPLSLIISTDTGKVFYMTRQYDRAIEQCKKVLEMDPNFAMAHVWLSFSYSAKGQHEEAIAEMHKAAT
jgi:tetratricopeptide (TPR) repeat protein